MSQIFSEADDIDNVYQHSEDDDSNHSSNITPTWKIEESLLDQKVKTLSQSETEDEHDVDTDNHDIESEVEGQDQNKEKIDLRTTSSRLHSPESINDINMSEDDVVFKSQTTTENDNINEISDINQDENESYDTVSVTKSISIKTDSQSQTDSKNDTDVDIDSELDFIISNESIENEHEKKHKFGDQISGESIIDSDEINDSNLKLKEHNTENIGSISNISGENEYENQEIDLKINRSNLDENEAISINISASEKMDNGSIGFEENIVMGNDESLNTETNGNSIHSKKFSESNHSNNEYDNNYDEKEKQDENCEKFNKSISVSVHNEELTDTIDKLNEKTPEKFLRRSYTSVSLNQTKSGKNRPKTAFQRNKIAKNSKVDTMRQEYTSAMEISMNKLKTVLDNKNITQNNKHFDNDNDNLNDNGNKTETLNQNDQSSIKYIYQNKINTILQDITLKNLDIFDYIDSVTNKNLIIQRDNDKLSKILIECREAVKLVNLSKFQDNE
ncbi:hypothetical protein A3Q56_05188, partial [Intoshia linei]